MRQPRTAVAGAAICVLTAGCAASIGNAESTTPTPTLIPRPVVERQLTGLLLNPDEVNAAMATTGMTVIDTQSAMSDNSATMEPRECLAVDGAAEAAVYADTGYWAEYDQSLNNGDNFSHYVKQAIVLFPSIDKAGAVFDASAGQWPGCHDYSHTQSGSKWTVGEVTNADNTLSTIATQQDAGNPGWACGRALKHENNVLIDVNTCSADPAASASAIAQQIASKVRSLW